MNLMKVISICLFLSILEQFTCIDAFAGTFTITRSSTGLISSFRGEAAAPKIGTVFGSNLIAVVNDSSLDIDEVEPETRTRKTVLSGVLFDTQVRKTDSRPSFNGFCFFNEGIRLKQLLGEDANTADLVMTINDHTLAGRITAVDRDQLTIIVGGITHIVPTKLIQTVVSSRVFKVTGLLFVASSVNIDNRDISGFQARILRFELDPTLDEFMTLAGKKRLETSISASGYTKLQKDVIIGVAIFATAAAIAIPISLAVPLAGRHRVMPATREPPFEEEIPVR